MASFNSRKPSISLSSILSITRSILCRLCAFLVSFIMPGKLSMAPVSRSATAVGLLASLPRVIAASCASSMTRMALSMRF